MSGYYGYSMSNNAVDCYNDGYMPLSKWTKKEILKRANEVINENNINLKIEFDDLKKLTLKELKEHCLAYNSWHHTSKMFNETAFYGIDEEWLEIVTNKEIDKIIGARTPKREEKQIEAYCQYLTWSGTRRYPKAEVHEDWGYIKGNWFYINGGSTRKCVNSRGFKILKTNGTKNEEDDFIMNYQSKSTEELKKMLYSAKEMLHKVNFYSASKMIRDKYNNYVLLLTEELNNRGVIL